MNSFRITSPDGKTIVDGYRVIGCPNMPLQVRVYKVDKNGSRFSTIATENRTCFGVVHTLRKQCKLSGDARYEWFDRFQRRLMELEKRIALSMVPELATFSEWELS
jgi:hypothetical protein